jgi:hypothetical protein
MLADQDHLAKQALLQTRRTVGRVEAALTAAPPAPSMSTQERGSRRQATPRARGKRRSSQELRLKCAAQGPPGMERAM